MKDHWHFIDEPLERDVRFFSAKFGLNRTGFRMLMECPIVSEHVHKLNYSEATAKDLMEALQPAFDAAYDGDRSIPRNALLRVIHKLKLTIAEKPES